MAAKNTDKSTTSSKPMGTLQAMGLCFKLPFVTTAKTAASVLIITDAAASALSDNQERLKKTGKHIINEGLNLVDMTVLATHRLNLEISNNLDVTLGDDLDDMISQMDKAFYEKKAKEENK